MVQIERLRAMAGEAIREYQATLMAGGEPAYPQWADDIMTVCDQAELSLLFGDELKPPTQRPRINRHHML